MGLFDNYDPSNPFQGNRPSPTITFFGNKIGGGGGSSTPTVRPARSRNAGRLPRPSEPGYSSLERSPSRPTSDQFNPSGLFKDRMAPGAVGEAQGAMDAALQAEIDKISAGFNSRIAAAGGGGYGAAIAEARKMIQDVRANREALQDVYGEYTGFVDPLGEEAIKAASEIVARGMPGLEQIAEEGQAGIEGAFDTAESGVREYGEKIGAGAGATESVVADAIDSEALRIASAIEEASTAENLLGLQQEQARTGAVADQSLHDEEFNRRTAMMDLEFNQMEESAKEQLAAAQRAAAAAAARRRALVSERNAAIAAAEAQQGRLSPFDAGEATALTYLRQNTGDMDYNRQQLVMSTLENALSQQVPANLVTRWAREQELNLRPSEANLVKGAVNAFTGGMRYQQERDSGARSPYSSRSSSFYGEQ